MNIFIKTFLIGGLTTGMASYAAHDAGEKFTSKTAPTYATFLHEQTSPLSIFITSEDGDKQNLLPDRWSAHNSPFKQLFEIDEVNGELARFANDFYGSCTTVQQQALDARHRGSTSKTAVRRRKINDDEESDSRHKNNDVVTDATHILVEDATKELVGLFNNYVKGHQQNIESLKAEHARKTRRTSCCTAITSIVTLVASNVLTSHLTKKGH